MSDAIVVMGVNCLFLCRLNSLRALATSKGENELDELEASDGEDVQSHDGSMMDFEQELLSLKDVMSPAPEPVPRAEIRVNSEDLVNRVAEVVMEGMKSELHKQTQCQVTLLSRIEDKLDQLLQQESQTNTATTPISKDARVCYYCREVGHLANKCKQRVACMGCGGDQHPYDRCAEQGTTCKKCDVVGHNSLVHETLDPALRKKLYDANPNEFAHFFSVDNRFENAQKRLYRGAVKRRNSWEESAKRGDKSRSISRSREGRDKCPRTEKGVKVKSSRRTI